MRKAGNFMDFETFKNELMELVIQELDNRGIENISLKFNTINSPDGMTDRLIATVGDSKMSMAFRLKEIFTDYENGLDLERCVDRICNTIKANITVIETKEQDVKAFVTDYEKVLSAIPSNVSCGNRHGTGCLCSAGWPDTGKSPANYGRQTHP